MFLLYCLPTHFISPLTGNLKLCNEVYSFWISEGFCFIYHPSLSFSVSPSSKINPFLFYSFQRVTGQFSKQIHWCSIYIDLHQVLLLLVEHRTSMKSFQALRSPTLPFSSLHDLPVFLISSSIFLRHFLFCLPLLLYPWGFQSNAVFSVAPAPLRNVCLVQFHFSVAPASLRNVCPIQFHFLLFYLNLLVSVWWFSIVLHL